MRSNTNHSGQLAATLRPQKRRRSAALAALNLMIFLVSNSVHADQPASNASCTKPASQQFQTNGWGVDLRNTRFQPNSTITASNVAQLELLWTFALEGGQSPHSYPLATQDSLFIGTQSGKLFALNRTNGCTRWTYQASDSIRTGLTNGRITTSATPAGVAALFFGTYNGTVEAVDILTGKRLWAVDIRDHDAQFNTGTPVFHAGKLYVPVSSREVGLAMSPLYGCCTSRGAIVALDAHTGQELWRTHSITQTPEKTGKRWLFINSWGPSGAPVWSAPTIDVDRGALLFGSGENYSAPASKGSDAITALDLTTGKRLWRQQYTAADNFNMACTVNKNHPNCPKENGPDLDFGAPPVLARIATANGPQEVVLAGQKSADVHAIDPTTGARLWTRNIGRGGYLGGVHWGMAVNEGLGLAFAPISDIRQTGPGGNQPAPGVTAIDIATGEVRWQAASAANCELPSGQKDPCINGYSAAPTANAELLFVAGLDGVLHALRGDTGEELWRYDTWHDYSAVNATQTLQASGGSIDVHGPLLVEDQLFIQSGYGSFGQKGGNALLAFKTEGATQ